MAAKDAWVLVIVNPGGIKQAQKFDHIEAAINEAKVIMETTNATIVDLRREVRGPRER